jgi:hypothetical protein
MLRLGPALVLAAPVVLGMLTYAWSAWVDAARVRDAIDPKAQVTPEALQIALHDALTRDLRRLTLPERPTSGRIPTYELALAPAEVDRLAEDTNKRAGAAGPKTYAQGLLRVGGRVHHVEVRARGEQPWHRLGAQRSLKLKVERGDLVEGMRVLNLLNDPTPFGLEEQLVLDLAREHGLITPELHPVWVRLNNHDMGVYRLEAQPDESLVRRSGHIPGDIFAGDAEKLSGGGAFGPLFTSTVGWTRLARRAEQAEGADASRAPGAGVDAPGDATLARFVDRVAHATHADFAAYASEALDLDRYATYAALDAAFGGDAHDLRSNHRFYVDPYRGRLEPVAWSFRGFRRSAEVDAIDSPLLVRLKLTPGWLVARDRALHQLLTGAASAPAVRERAERWMSALAPELAADPYWDAYKLLPRASKIHRATLRPMTTAKWRLAAEYELDGFARRSRVLLDVLEAQGVDVTATATADGLALELTVRGHGAYAVEAVRVGPSCGRPSAILADTSLDGRFDVAVDERVDAPAPNPVAGRALRGAVSGGETLTLATRAELTPRVRLVARDDADAKRGSVRAVDDPTAFRYLLVGARCAAEDVEVVARSLVTGTRARLAVRGRAAVAPLASSCGAASLDDPLALDPGVCGPHPWQFPAPARAQRVVLGPGRVEFPETRRFTASERVEVLAGTTLALGPGASLVFRGPVHVAGTPDAPVVVERLDPARAFGGVALVGPGTAGSQLVELTIVGGARPRGETVELTGPLGVHDTRQVALRGVRVRETAPVDDVIHAYRVDELALEDVEVEGAPVDAVDLEFVRGEVRGLRVIGAGDDGLDLMGVHLRIEDSLVAAVMNNGISAGEESEVTATSLVVAHAKTGILAKNASRVRLVRALVGYTQVALRARHRETRYAGPSHVSAAETFIVDAVDVDQAEEGSTVDIAPLRTELPGEGELGHVLGRVLGARRWDEVASVLAALGARRPE